MNRDGFIIFIIILVTATYFLTNANLYKNYGELSKFDNEHYTLYVTSGTVTEIVIRSGNYYYYSSATIEYHVKGSNYAEEYIVIGPTTSIQKIYLKLAFNDCNLADPLLSGKIIWPTTTYLEKTIKMMGLYRNACYLFSPMYGTGIMTVTIKDATMIGWIPGYGITFTLKG